MGEIFPRPQPSEPMPFTGERLTSALSGQTEIEHLHRYLLARELCRGKEVIDVASGEGYGSALLAQVASFVTGVEIAADAVTHAASSYSRPNLRFLQGDARAMGLAGAIADVVVSFETIEHFAEHEAFLGEIRRVLRPGGMLVVSTPDQDNYSPADAPANPFHVRELAKTDFSQLLRSHFRHACLLHQRPMIGSVMLPSERAEAPSQPLTFEKRGDHLEFSTGLPRPQYIIAIASDQPIGPLPPSVYIETSRVGYLAEPASDAIRTEIEALRGHLHETIAAKNSADARLLELQRSLDAAQEAASAQAAAETRIADLQRALEVAKAGEAALERACQRAEQAGRDSRQQLAECRERAVRQEARVAALLSSSSWRITAPLRTLLSSLRRG